MLTRSLNSLPTAVAGRSQAHAVYGSVEAVAPFPLCILIKYTPHTAGCHNAKIIPYNYDQASMIVINFKDQLQPGTFEYAIHYLIDEKLDLSIFYPKFKNNDGGRPAYDPAILLTIILFAYSKGITSSRETQWCCETNIILKALSCDTVVHFTTIAAFVSGHALEI